MSVINIDTRSSTPNDEKTNENKKELIQNDFNNIKDNINHKLNSSISITLLNLISENRSKHNYKELLKKQKNNVFNSLKVPKLSLGDFMYRITYYSKVNDEILISSLILIDRYCKKNKIILTVYNIHYLLFTSILVTIKFMEDKFFSNKYYATICGIKLSHLNKMEYEFLCGIKFEIFIHEKFFVKYQNLLLEKE